MTTRELLAVCFCFCAILGAEAFGCNVSVEYASAEYDTNFVASVAAGESFTLQGKFTEGKTIASLNVERFPEQLNHKNFLLSVGLSECNSSMKLKAKECFANDAYALAENYAVKIFPKQILITGNLAKKVIIRQNIKTIAAELEKDDIFFFYYSGIVDADAKIAAYDDYYTAEEFIEDLGHFKDGVVRIILLDADNADLIAGKGLFKDDPNFLIMTASKNGKKLKKLSPFNLGVSRSLNCATDLNKDGLLSFLEIFERARCFPPSKKSARKTTISNEDLASKMVLSPLPWNSGEGILTVNEDNTFSFFLPCVNCDTFITIAEGEYEDLAPIYLEKSALKAKLRGGNEPSYPTKFSMSFKMDDPGEIDNMCFYLGDRMLIYETLVKKTKKGVAMRTDDYAFKKLGVMKAKLKKDGVHFKINFKADSPLANILTFSEGTESVPLQLRFQKQPLTPGATGISGLHSRLTRG